MKFILSDEDKEKKVKLYLREEIREASGEVVLCAEDNGVEWVLMVFRSGKFKRITNVSASVAVDFKGRIVEEE